MNQNIVTLKFDKNSNLATGLTATDVFFFHFFVEKVGNKKTTLYICSI